jgi:hypothetical protein
MEPADLRADILKESDFEHLEVEPLVNFPNPPVAGWAPNEPEGSSKKFLKPAHMYALAWMNSRMSLGGGIIGDQMGMGKVHPLQ